MVTGNGVSLRGNWKKVDKMTTFQLSDKYVLGRDIMYNVMFVANTEVGYRGKLRE